MNFKTFKCMENVRSCSFQASIASIVASFVSGQISSCSADEIFLLTQLCIRFSVPLVIMAPDGL